MKKWLIGLAIAVGLILLCLISGYLTLVRLTGPETDNELIGKMFDKKLRESGHFEIISRAGKANPNDPRILRFRVALNGYTSSMVCEGEIVYIHADPSYIGINWDTPECEAQYQFVGGTNQY
jgi:hypothetical protein